MAAPHPVPPHLGQASPHVNDVVPVLCFHFYLAFVTHFTVYKGLWSSFKQMVCSKCCNRGRSTKGLCAPERPSSLTVHRQRLGRRGTGWGSSPAESPRLHLTDANLRLRQPRDSGLSDGVAHGPDFTSEETEAAEGAGLGGPGILRLDRVRLTPSPGPSLSTRPGDRKKGQALQAHIPNPGAICGSEHVISIKLRVQLATNISAPRASHARPGNWSQRNV